MSSSRILSSRPSASCITAKPIARTIKGRGRNAPPFFAAQKLGKPRGFSPEPAGGTALWLSVPEPAQPIAGALWGHWAFPYRPTGSGKAEGFSPEPPGALIYGSLPGTRTAHCWGAVGVMGAFAPPSRKQESRAGFSIRARQGRCFMSLRPGTCTAHCWGVVGELALPHHPAGSRKAEGAFPSEPAGGTDLRLAA